MHDRWNKQFELEGVEDEFDWDSFKRTCRSKSDWQQIWFAKHNSRIGGIRQNLVRRKHGEDPTCPCYGEVETTDHIYQCTNIKMQDTYEANMEEVTSHLRAISSKAISDTITCNAIREGRDCALDGDWDPTLLNIAHQQIGAGQRSFTGGLWPLAWRTAQQDCYAII